MKKLIICAHPDDETLFFSSILDENCQVICVTDANADNRGKQREIEFAKACQSFGILEYEMWDFPDIYEKRLSQNDLQKRLNKLDRFDIVYTHGPIGEYGHPHHQDVSYACYQVFDQDKIWVNSFNTFPSKSVELSENKFNLKMKVLTEIYGEETKRFLNLIPVTPSEHFVQLSKKEVNSIYLYLTNQSNEIDLVQYQGLKNSLESVYKDRARLF